MTGETQCIRCGKLRILDRTWIEYIGISKVTYTQSVCPDTACQKLVDETLKERRDIATNRIQESLRRREETRNRRFLTRKTNSSVKEDHHLPRK